jgi:hypothetical protein
MAVGVFILAILMTRVLMMVVSVLALMRMTLVSRCMLVPVGVSMFVFMPVLVRVFGIAMRVLVRVSVGMRVFMIVSVLVSFFHVYISPTKCFNLNYALILLYSGRQTGAYRQARACIFPVNPYRLTASSLSDKHDETLVNADRNS